MSAILTSDIHLQEGDLSEYRWGLFSWLEKKVLELHIDVVIFGGDHTEKKDSHPASLVNRFVDKLDQLAHYTQIILLEGNHDRIQAGNPFFRFTNKAGIEFISQPTALYIPIIGTKTPCLFLPTANNPEKDWEEWIPQFNKFKLIFCHQTFNGSIAENGQTLTGISPAIFKDFTGKVWSGDIHKPQKIGKNIEYLGSPYHCRFGDDFIPRVVHLTKSGTARDLHFPTIQKHAITIRQFDDLSGWDTVEPGDQVRIKVQLHRKEYPMWPELRTKIIKFMADKKWVNCGLSTTTLADTIKTKDNLPAKTVNPIDLVTHYAESRKLDKQLTETGLNLIREIIK